jgi:hypothetical protein
MNRKGLLGPLVLNLVWTFTLLSLHGTASAAPVHGGPEIDAGAAAAGIGLLCGGIFLLIERFRRR